jgi:hypothetical protein
MQIKMVTDLVAELEQKMLQLGRDTYESSDQLLSSVNRDFWQGRGADEFKQRAREVCNKLHLFAEEITKLGFALSLEKEEWIRVDQEGINRLKKNVIKPSPVKEVPLTEGEEMLSDLMIRMIEDSQLGKNYSNSRVIAENFDKEKIISKWDKLLKKG